MGRVRTKTVKKVRLPPTIARAHSHAARPRRFRAAPSHGDAIARERPRDAARFRRTRCPSRGRETRERARTWSFVIDRTSAVALGGLAWSSVPRRASRRARAVAKTFRVLQSCASAFSSSPSALPGRARETRHAADLPTPALDSFLRRPRASSSRSTTLV